MNFAFATLLILFLSLPGIAFRKAYYAGKFSSSGFSTDFISLLIWSIVPALFFHAIAILLIEFFTDIRIELSSFGYLISGGNDEKTIFNIMSNIHGNLWNIFKYNVGLILFGILLGCGFRYAVRNFGLDITFKLLRFPNEWHYIFTGEYLNFDKGKSAHKKVDIIFVDVLVDVGPYQVIYSGIFEDYFLSKGEGGLDRIIIKYPTKKNFNIEGDYDPKDIPGNYISIPYSNIINMNYTYFNFEDLSDKKP